LVLDWVGSNRLRHSGKVYRRFEKAAYKFKEKQKESQIIKYQGSNRKAKNLSKNPISKEYYFKNPTLSLFLPLLEIRIFLAVPAISPKMIWPASGLPHKIRR
jgi:hypothetical protein